LIRDGDDGGGGGGGGGGGSLELPEITTVARGAITIAMGDEDGASRTAFSRSIGRS